MTRTCSTCLCWTPFMEAHPKIGPPTSWAGEVVQREVAMRVGGICNSPKIGEKNAMEYEPDTLVYPYDEGAEFWTGPLFGCVHHRAKPTFSGRVTVTRAGETTPASSDVSER